MHYDAKKKRKSPTARSLFNSTAKRKEIKSPNYY